VSIRDFFTGGAGVSAQAEAVAFLKSKGYWEPMPGSKAILNPRLYWPYFAAVAFAIDDESGAVHVINDAQDIPIYADAAFRAQEIAAGRFPAKLKHRTYTVVRRQAA